MCSRPRQPRSKMRPKVDSAARVLADDQRSTPASLVALNTASNYRFGPVTDAHGVAAYDALVQSAYTAIGTICDAVLPRHDTRRFELTFSDELAGICGLRPPAHEALYRRYVPGLA